MTVIKVVDASALAALLFDEPEGGTVLGQLKGSRLMAPHLLDLELANICGTKARRRLAELNILIAAFAMRKNFRIEARSVDADAVLALALATDLTPYDASYLWLARAMEAELVTLDKALARAATIH